MAGLVGSQRMVQSSFQGSRLSASVAPRKVCSFAVTPITAVNPFKKGKSWETTEVNKNGKPVRQKVHVLKGDTVQIIAGKDKGKVGEVTAVLTIEGQIVVEGVNVKTKTTKPVGEDTPGTITKQERPIHSSNVMLYSKEQQVRSRVGHKILEDGSKVRYLLKTGEVLKSNALTKEAS